MEESKKKIIAIMGPSGAGKTTLGYGLSERYDLAIPCHCTTRSRRSDDKPGFYRYFEHEEYAKRLENGEFLISSGDGPVVDKKYGNFYGVLKSDCDEAFRESDTIILFVSYKDIETLQNLKATLNASVSIVNLTFKDIPKGVENRIRNDSTRNHTQDDIIRRIKCAQEDHKKYSKALEKCADLTLYTELYTIQQTIDKVATDLSIENDDR